MSRIDAAVATQISDITRPRQSISESALQGKESQVRSMDNEESALSTSQPQQDEVRTAAAKLKKVVESASGRQLSFDFDDSSKTLLVKVTDKTGEVLRQIPSKEILNLHQRLESLVGMIIDKKA